MLTTPAAAGFISIDGFSDPLQSDGIGDRTTEGLVTFLDDGLSLSAYAVSGVTSMPVASVIYRFTPTPLVAAPMVVVLARNSQQSVAETGILRMSVDDHSLSYVLPGAQQAFVSYSFDFRSVLSDVSSMREIRLDWLREDGHGGAKQLIIDSIDVHAVPEPSTLGLIGLATGGAWMLRRKKGKQQKGANDRTQLQPRIPTHCDVGGFAMSDRPTVGQLAYNPIEKPIRYPLELCDNLHICLWDESGKFKWTIALFHQGSEGYDLRFIGPRPLDARVDWTHFGELVIQGQAIADQRFAKEADGDGSDNFS
jgi:hypothetical protein